MFKASASAAFVAVLCVLGLILQPSLSGTEKEGEKGGTVKERYFEMRTYTAAPGKLDALHARFRDHTNKLFQKHGMTLIGYWTPAEGDTSKNTLVYILAYPDKEAREKAWKEFQDDPDWKKARAESETNGALVTKAESVFLKPTDYSPIK